MTMNMINTRRTKIIATLGPASSSEEMIRKLITSGANVFRLNFSHGAGADQADRVALIRRVAKELDQQIAILGDLQGPKIRTCSFVAGSVDLTVGAEFTLDADMAADAGHEKAVGIAYAGLVHDCKPGNMLLLDDGRIELQVERIEGNRIVTRVVVGGKLSNKKGINLAGGGLSAPALTEKDYEDIKAAVEFDLDYLAVSFPKSAEDMHLARNAAVSAGFAGKLVAKIERSEAVADPEHLDDLIRASDAVMVARGDLGVEIGDAQLVGVQKRIILRARQLDRVVITATQMMESMIESPLPTRAEVFDVANAVLDGTDAVMLSAETATGKHPEKVVQAMDRVIRGAEKERMNQVSQHRLDRFFGPSDEVVAMAAMYAANHMKDMRAIICFTESGTTPLLMSRIRSGIPIYALSPNEHTLRLAVLYRGVTPIYFDKKDEAVADSILGGVQLLKEKGLLKTGDNILVTVGERIFQSGHTNTLKILEVDG
jgi:pyruvate kinase